MTFNAHDDNGWEAVAQAHEPLAEPALYVQLSRAFERQLVWATDFARAGDLSSARDARLAADAICDELSAD
jgi:hypothetical protein